MSSLTKAIRHVNSKDFHIVTKKLRDFFDKRGFIESHVQNRLSILAACEDPKTIALYNYADNIWPMPQTGQMWLEHEMLTTPAEGYYCLTTSYRNEPNPVPNRHDLIFPMFEFEMKGVMKELNELEYDLVKHLGYDKTMAVSRLKDIPNKVINLLDV